MGTGNVCYLFAFRFYQGALEIIVESPSVYQYFMKCCFPSVWSRVGSLALGLLWTGWSKPYKRIPPNTCKFATGNIWRRILMEGLGVKQTPWAQLGFRCCVLDLVCVWSHARHLLPIGVYFTEIGYPSTSCFGKKERKSTFVTTSKLNPLELLKLKLLLNILLISIDVDCLVFC